MRGHQPEHQVEERQPAEAVPERGGRRQDREQKGKAEKREVPAEGAEKGAAHLFWGQAMTQGQGEAHLTNVVRTIEAYEAQVREVELRRQGALEDLGRQQDEVDFLAEDLFDLEEEEEIYFKKV